MTPAQMIALGPAFSQYLRFTRPCFATRNSFAHLNTYGRGLLSDLSRKSVEPIALCAGVAVRTLQEFLTHHTWDEARLRDLMRQRVVAKHLPPPGPPDHAAPPRGVGVVGWIDETSVAKKGDKTPGVQRQYCGASGKIDNCVVTVHLACKSGTFMALLDSDLFLPEEAWHAHRDRCRGAHIPDEVVYRSKWRIALEQVRRAAANGVRFDWLTFDEWYGGKPEFLDELDKMGQRYVCEVPANFVCFPTPPRYQSPQTPFAPKRVDHAVVHGKPFHGLAWQTLTLQRQTLAPQTWRVKAAQVHFSNQGRCTDRTYWLIVARNPDTDEVKYFVANAPPFTALTTLMQVAFTRAGVEHVFRLAKTEIGLDHFEGRSYVGLMRHLTLCQLVLLFVAEETDRLRGEKPAGDDGADRPRPQHPLPPLAPTPLPPDTVGSHLRHHSISPGTQRGRQTITVTISHTRRVAL